jgi:hypothetical protein
LRAKLGARREKRLRGEREKEIKRGKEEKENKKKEIKGVSEHVRRKENKE